MNIESAKLGTAYRNGYEVGDIRTAAHTNKQRFSLRNS
jgi:hypothetical protein